MENSKNTKNLNVNPEQENEDSLIDVDLDNFLTDDESAAMEAAEVEVEDVEEIEEKKPRRRGRPRKNESLKKTARKKSANRTSKKATTVEPRTYAGTSSEKKRPKSFLNLLLFALIFAALVAAQFVMKMDNNNKETINVEAVEITAEERIVPNGQNTEKPEIAIDSEFVEPVMSDVIETERTEKRVEEDAIKETEEKIEAAVETPVKEESRAEVETENTQAGNSARKFYSNYYRPDPWTNGSSLDLDGPNARYKYKRQNRQKVVRKVYKPKKIKKKYYYDYETYHDRSAADTRYKHVERYPSGYEKYEVKETRRYPKSDLETICAPYYNNRPKSYRKVEKSPYRENYNRDNYTDRRNPWNSGGAQDLDHPTNQPRKVITKRTYYDYGY